jgi:AcrR family transcriptional regulator
MSERPTKQHILESAVAAIERHGIHGLTTRAIAAQAGVNNAALHYYFGTKEALIQAALALTLDNMMVDTQAILASGEGLEDRLRTLFDYMVQGTLAFPNVIRAHLWAPLMEGAEDSPFMRMLDAWMDHLVRELRNSLSSIDEPGVRRALSAALGGTVFLALMPEGPSGRMPSLRTPASRRRFVDQLVRFVMVGARGAGPVRKRRPR